jgi:hypothetical protein
MSEGDGTIDNRLLLRASLSTSFTRLSLGTLALVGCGLFVAELIRNQSNTASTRLMNMGISFSFMWPAYGLG